MNSPTFTSVNMQLRSSSISRHKLASTYIQKTEFWHAVLQDIL